MPILRGAVTFSRFRVEPLDDSTSDWKKNLARSLRTKGFTPLDRKNPEDRSAGFVELEELDKREFSAGSVFSSDYALFSYRIDEFRIPASLVRTELERWQKEFQKEHERLPGRREKSDAKQEIRHTIRARAPIATKTFDVNWNLSTNLLQIWAASRKTIDEVQVAIEQCFKARLVPLVPVVAAEALGIDEKSLAPTPALSLPDTKSEVRRGEA